MDNRQQTEKNTVNPVSTEIFRYEADGGVSEYHLMIHYNDPTASYEEQLNAVTDTYYQLRERELKGAVAVFQRIRLTACWHSPRSVRTVHSPSCSRLLLTEAKSPCGLTCRQVYRRKYCTTDSFPCSTALTVIYGAGERIIGLPIRSFRPAFC